MGFLPDHVWEVFCTIDGGETFATFHRSSEEAEMAREILLGLRSWDDAPASFGLVLPKGARVVAAVVRFRGSKN
ncbi:MAG TPA: hypothetical protein VGN14_07550 [Candidatus Elarobacter sp.]